MNKYILSTILLVIIFCQSLAQNASSIHGIVRNIDNSNISFAQVSILELDLSCTTNDRGAFRFDNIPTGKYTIYVRASGYNNYSSVIDMSKEVNLTIVMEEKSLRLKEVVVMSKAVNKTDGTKTIDNQAIEHLQPNSISDIFQLLPGRLTRDGNMNEINQFSSRQSGKDSNTALGTAVYSNGTPISNDANMQIVMADQLQRNKSNVNGGIDLRTISTDHLEKVDIMEGIPVARYGNITSGVILTKSKSGYFPISIRMKSDPNTKLIYAGKGFDFHKNGSLYIGADFTYSKPSVRETLSQYSRYTLLSNYNNTLDIKDNTLDIGCQISYIGTADGKKTDIDLDRIINDYRDNYNSISLSNNLKLNTGNRIFKTLESNISLSYSHSMTIRDMIISTGGTTPLPLSTESGEFEGIYLPVEYNSRYTLDGKPVSLFAFFSNKSIYGYKNISGSLDIGVEYVLEKNIGEGYDYDIMTPPFPLSPTSSRPRKFSDVPSYQRLAMFIDNSINICIEDNIINMLGGIRLSNMPNVSDIYKNIKDKIFIEPRLNISYRIPKFRLIGVENEIKFRMGLGRSIKFPTMDILEPAQFYRDFKSFDYFAKEKDKRYLLVTTVTGESKNPEIMPNINDKMELALNYNIGKARFEIIGFYEIDKKGFSYNSNFRSFMYNVYKIENHTNGVAIEKDHLKPQNKTVMYEYLTPYNSSLVNKVGLEYSISIPKMNIINTSLEINGAYYHTYYDISEPIMKRPNVRINGKEYEFVGYYGHDRGNYKKQLNTNIWLNTHIPAYRLVFTSKIQFLWFTDYTDKFFDGIPEYYFGLSGEKTVFTESNKDDPILRHLLMSKPDEYFMTDRSPMELSLDLKTTKEINDNIRISFFVNRILFFSPARRGKFNIYEKVRRTPYFGIEMNIKI